MTIDEFNRTGFGGGMFAIYRGQKYPIVAVAFDEALVALSGVVEDAEYPHWARCENIKIVHNAELCGGTSATNAVLNGEL